VDGEIGAAELYRRTVARYRKTWVSQDPYSDPVSGVLYNRLKLRSAAALEADSRSPGSILILSTTSRPPPRSCAAIPNRCATCSAHSSSTVP